MDAAVGIGRGWVQEGRGSDKLRDPWFVASGMTW